MVPIPSPLRKDLLMSCLSALLALVAVATVLPPLAAQKKEPQAERPSPLIVLREELLQEQQTLYGLETEWLLHLVKLKQRLEKVGTDMARQEAAVCAMLLGGARDLPPLYDNAVVRLKQVALGNLESTREAAKATGALSDELHRFSQELKKARPLPFKAEREVELPEARFGFVLLDVCHNLDRAALALGDSESTATILERHQAARKFLQRAKASCQATPVVFRRGDADEGPPGKRSTSFGAKLAASLDGLLAEKGQFARAEAAVSALQTQDPAGKETDALVAAARKELRELRSALEREETVARLVVIGGLLDLTSRQKQLHGRLKQHHDETVGKLLEGLDKAPD
jgi:hypothetical protein